MIDAGAIGPSAALIAGLAGSAHCFAMCGGLSSALALKAHTPPVGTPRSLTLTVAQHLARVGGYSVAGAASGAAGGAIQLVLDLARVGTILRIASGILLLLLAARLLLHWNALARLERLGAKFWSVLRPLATYGANASGFRQALTLGFLWGWLPCGLVYSMLLFAATSGSAIDGAIIMSAFGLGTLPSMLASSVFAAKVRRLLGRKFSRTASACMLLACGAWLIVAALLPMHAHVH